MSKPNPITIDVCIATYKRPHLLEKLLQSLTEQSIINSIYLRIIIIDNDPEKSAENIVESFFDKKDFVYIYDVQPEKNISLTRNKALDYSNAEYIAFIDDDEWADPTWLESLLTTSQQFDADVVFGPVFPVLPDTAPKWIKKGGFFSAGACPLTGTSLQHGASNNTLIHNAEFISELQFEPDYGLTGGEDTELFHRLYLNGAKLIWCNEAVVYEHVSENRLNLKWLCKRSLREGQVYAKIIYSKESLSIRLIQIIKRITILFFVLCIFPLALFLGKCKWVWILRKIMTNAGQISSLINNQVYQEYK